MTTTRLDPAPRFTVHSRPALRSLVVAAICALIAAALLADLHRGARPGRAAPPVSPPATVTRPVQRTS